MKPSTNKPPVDPTNITSDLDDMWSIDIYRAAKVSSTPTDKNSVKRISYIAGEFLRRLLRLVHLGEEIQRDTDFLGYEAYSSRNVITSRGLSEGKEAEKASKARFTEHGQQGALRKAAWVFPFSYSGFILW